MKEFNCLALRSNFKPYQQKTWYEAEPDSSEIEDSDQDSINEDILFSQEQPYETPTQVNYGQFLKQVMIPEYTKRSDIMITSTISMSIFPKDLRKMQQMYFANMNKRDIFDYIEQKNAFSAMVKELSYRQD